VGGCAGVCCDGGIIDVDGIDGGTEGGCCCGHENVDVIGAVDVAVVILWV